METRGKRRPTIAERLLMNKVEELIEEDETDITSAYALGYMHGIIGAEGGDNDDPREHSQRRF